MKILFTSVVSLLSISASAGITTTFQYAAAVISEIQPPVEVVPEKVVNYQSATSGAEIVSFAKTLTGTPYVYGSMDPSKGFDCSGFINYVANHFGYKVPRSSVDFTNFGSEISLADAKEGDIILFTGTDASARIVGHMGIVTSNQGGRPAFIHATSGKAHSVTESEFSSHYQERFVKVIRIFS